MINEAYPDVPIDTPITLVLDGIAAELSGFVARKDADATLVKFELSEQACKLVGELVSVRQAA